MRPSRKKGEVIAGRCVVLHRYNYAKVYAASSCLFVGSVVLIRLSQKQFDLGRADSKFLDNDSGTHLVV